MVNAGAVGTEPDRVVVAFDDERAVADAGVVLPAVLAARLGIEALVDRAVCLGDRVVDLGDADDMRRAADQVLERHGRCVLVGDDAAALTGQTLTVDGGVVLR